jgi:hypothetical protein
MIDVRLSEIIQAEYNKGAYQDLDKIRAKWSKYI